MGGGEQSDAGDVPTKDRLVWELDIHWTPKLGSSCPVVSGPGAGKGVVGLLCLKQNAARGIHIKPQGSAGAVCSQGDNKVAESRGLHCL